MKNRQLWRQMTTRSIWNDTWFTCLVIKMSLFEVFGSPYFNVLILDVFNIGSDSYLMLKLNEHIYCLCLHRILYFVFFLWAKMGSNVGKWKKNKFLATRNYHFMLIFKYIIITMSELSIFEMPKNDFWNPLDFFASWKFQFW